ncbi:MAG: hypothetical protein RIS17_3 [Pseudomonadota bacterium]
MNHSLFLVGQNDIARTGLAMILADVGLEVVSASDDVKQLPVPEALPALALIDFDTLERRIEAITTLRSTFANVRPVVLANEFDFGEMAECFRAGAHGYILKKMSCEQLVASLTLAALGEKVMPSDLADALPPQAPQRDYAVGERSQNCANLSDREQDVLCGLSEGHPNKIIARQLEVSEATVKVHVKSILRKLNLANRTQAAIWATSHGIASDAHALSTNH